MGERTYLEYTEGTSNKFWEAEVDGSDLTTRWGRVGTDGQTKTKSFESEALAIAALAKAAKAKVKKGYAEIDVAPDSEDTATAATATATPSSSAKKASQEDAAKEVVAKDEVVASAPAAVVEVTAEIAWTEELLARVAPTPGKIHTPLPPPVTTLEAALATRHPIDASASYEGHGIKRLGAGIPKVVSWLRGDHDELTLDEVEAGIIAFTGAQMSSLLSYASIAFGVKETLERLITSLEFASLGKNTERGKETVTEYTFAKATDIEGNGQSYSSPTANALYFKLDGFIFARRLLATLPVKDYAELQDLAREVWGKTCIPHQAALAMLFPDTDEWVEELREQVVGSYRFTNCTSMVVAGSTDPKQQQRTLKPYYYPLRLEPALFWTIIYQHGADALSILSSVANVGETIEAARIIRSPDAMPYWCELVEEDGARFDAVLEAISGFPVLALVGLSRIDRAVARVLAAALASGEPELVARALATEGVNEARLRPLVAVHEDHIANKSMWPEVLRDPPWKRKKKKASKAFKFDLSVSLPTTIDIPKDVRTQSVEKFRYWVPKDAKEVESLDKKLIEQIRRQVTTPSYSWYISNQTQNLLLLGGKGAIRKMWEEVPRDFWKVESHHDTTLLYALVMHGEEHLDIVLDFANRRIQAGVKALQHVTSVEVARIMAEGYARIKSTRQESKDWLDKNSEYAIVALVPDAFGKDRKRRNYAEKTISYLAREHDHEALLDAAREHYEDEVVEALVTLLDRDPLEELPRKMPKVPGWLTPQVLPALVFIEDHSKRLPDEAIQDILQMLAIYDPENPYPGIEQLSEVFTQGSLDEFSLAVCQAWLAMDGSSKQAWALRIVGPLGHDGAVRALTGKIRKWPGESAAKRAQWGLDVLAEIGTDLALMNIYNIAQKIKYKSLKAHASNLVDQIAAERGLTLLELGDRLVPDFDLDARGRLYLNFGPREFEICFDEQLKPIIRNDAGKIIKSLPKPGKKDNEEMAKEARKAFSGLKKDLKTVAKQQLQRLEDALVQQRRWSSKDFVAFLVEHPLMINLTHRLIWGAFDKDACVASFRVDLDHSFLDHEDEEVSIEGYEIGLIHPTTLSEGDITAWQTTIAEYEIIQPFEQLGRLFFPREVALKRLEEEVIGAKLTAPKLVYGLEKLRWERGSIEDAGSFNYHTKPLASGENIIIAYDGCVGVGFIEEGENLTIEEVYVAKDYRWTSASAQNSNGLEKLGDITLSEITQELLSITA